MFSYLCNNEADVRAAIPKLQSNIHYHHDKIPNDGVGRKMLGVEFIKTTRPENLNMSFRIVVAGSKVVTGYARLAPSKDWIAITNRFDLSMEEPFVKYQKVCQMFCEENEALIVKAVKSLGLNFQGVDVVLENSREGTLVFQSNQIDFELPLVDISSDDKIFEVGGLGKRVRVCRMPIDNDTRNFAFQREVPLRDEGDTRLFVKVTLEDGNQAWSSPIYFFRG